MPPFNPNLYGGNQAGNLGSVKGNDLTAILNEFVGLLDDPELLKGLNQLGINIQGGKDNKNFLNLLPALLGTGFGFFNQPTQFTPSFDPIEGAIEGEKNIALGEIDRAIGEQTGNISQDLYAQGLGPLAIADFTQQAKERGAFQKGDIGAKYTNIKRKAKFDFDQAVNALKQQYDFATTGSQNQTIADIGQLLTLFLL